MVNAHAIFLPVVGWRAARSIYCGIPLNIRDTRFSVESWGSTTRRCHEATLLRIPRALEYFTAGYLATPLSAKASTKKEPMRKSSTPSVFPRPHHINRFGTSRRNGSRDIARNRVDGTFGVRGERGLDELRTSLAVRFGLGIRWRIELIDAECDASVFDGVVVFTHLGFSLEKLCAVVDPL